MGMPIIKRIIRNASLRSKVSWMFFVLLLIPLLAFTLYATNRIQKVTQEQTFTTANKMFDESLASINSLTKKMHDVSGILANNPEVYQTLTPKAEGYSVFQQYSDYLRLSSVFAQLHTLSGVDDIRLFSDNDYFFSDSRNYFSSLEKAKNQPWYEALSSFPSKQWFAPADFKTAQEENNPCFSYMRTLLSFNNQSNAVLRVDISSQVFEQCFSQSSVTANDEMLLLSQQQVLLSSKPQTAVFDEAAISKIYASDSQEWNVMNLQGQDYYVICAPVETSGWKLASLLQVSDLTAVSRKLSFEMTLIMLVLGCLAYAVAMYLANYILKRVDLLTKATQRIEHGNANIQLNDESTDEIGQLVRSFNQMAGRIDRLMDEKIQYGQDIKNLELKALQAQINPHFLYNTLDTINCMAIRKDAKEITDVVSSLATFYKISLSKGSDHITIHDEFAHAQMYMNILNARFPNKIHTIWDLPEEIGQLHIIKIVLQPIIENAAIHGIYESETGTGNITVKAWLDNDDVYITITDDGVGMTQDVIDRNFPRQTERIVHVSGGYGIRNVCDRIRIAYGFQYGLSCESVVGKGTKVTVHIPKMQ